MLKTVFLSTLFSLSLLLLPVSAETDSLTTNSPDNQWLTIQSDDGEFSIDVPETTSFYVDKEGFVLNRYKYPDQYEMKNMVMLNGMINGTLLSFESYQTKSGALEAQYEKDVLLRKNIHESVLNRQTYSIKQFVDQDESFYLARQYFYSKKHIYILTAASRTGETPEMRKFLDSLNFTPDSKHDAGPYARPFSILRVTDIIVDLAPIKGKVTQDPKEAADLQAEKENPKNLIIVMRQRPSYTNVAREKGIKGIVILRVTFSQYGFIPKITVLKSLPGLVREALLAAVRIKFLPSEKDGKPQSMVRTVEYSFDIY